MNMKYNCDDRERGVLHFKQSLPSPALTCLSGLSVNTSGATCCLHEWPDRKFYLLL